MMNIIVGGGGKMKIHTENTTFYSIRRRTAKLKQIYSSNFIL